jgi:hypothetical protein
MVLLDIDRSTIRIDPDGTAAIIECVLSLCGGARQQNNGECEKPLHHDLLSSGNSAPSLRLGIFLQRELHHFHTMNLVLVALVQRVFLKPDWRGGRG